MLCRTRVFFIAIAAGLAACTPAPDIQAPVRAAQVLRVSKSILSADSEFAGEVLTRVESRLGLRVGGKLTARHVELRQRVKAGQLLAEIDAQDYRLSVDNARAQWNAAQTNHDLAVADFKRRETVLKSAQAQLEQARVQLWPEQSIELQQIGC
ncbi:MAG: biotin/lipoyl-binding protein [Limnohabitans sp.]|nr:biotin/lipoyl-binding protein [Limnohabitans sp.]